MEIKRKKFQGVLNILSFNRHFYYIGISIFAILLFLFVYFKLPPVLTILLILSFAYGLLMPLAVSAYVYDFSGYYDFKWLEELKKENRTVQKIVNINAGFDETSYIIENHFPQAKLQVFDFYDESRHTEPAIIRARKVSLIYPNTKSISSEHIPLEDHSVDYIFLLSSVHEIRDFNEKLRFFKECRRALNKGGRLVVVEHLRDFPNFLAFTVGFTHFFSKSTWEKAFKAGGFKKIKEDKFTPFMSIFICQ